jgi:hypothetical protein
MLTQTLKNVVTLIDKVVNIVYIEYNSWLLGIDHDKNWRKLYAKTFKTELNSF